LQTPEVDVLLATYNGDRLFASRSIRFWQDYPTLRILASDDGSSDRTLEILSEYADQFPSKIRLMEKQGPDG
jgi:glycosyltransferase involved in cell wall biosynthesis